MKNFLTLLIIRFDFHQTYKEISPNICQNDCHQKQHKYKEKINSKIPNVGEEEGKTGNTGTVLMKFLIGVGPIETVQRFFKKLRVEIPYDSAIPLLGMCLKKMKILIQKDICTPKFTAVLFIMDKIGKQPKCP